MYRASFTTTIGFLSSKADNAVIPLLLLAAIAIFLECEIRNNAAALLAGGVVGFILRETIALSSPRAVVMRIPMPGGRKWLSPDANESDMSHGYRKDAAVREFDAIELFREDPCETTDLKPLKRDVVNVSEAGDAIRAAVAEFEKSLAFNVAGLIDAAKITHRGARTTAQSSSHAHVTANAISETFVDICGIKDLAGDAAAKLAQTVEDLAKRAVGVSRMGAATAKRTTHANSELEKLASAVSQVMPMTELIHKIAQQTNLLALNATIEAAHAGNAGRGFAVVAREVKLLAQETSKATDQIAQRIEAVRGSCEDVVSTIKVINFSIDDLRSAAVDIASVIHEQWNATKEIEANVKSISDRADLVANNIADLDKTTSAADDNAQQFVEQTTVFVDQANQIAHCVERFLNGGFPRLDSMRFEACDDGAARPSPGQLFHLSRGDDAGTAGNEPTVL